MAYQFQSLEKDSGLSRIAFAAAAGALVAVVGVTSYNAASSDLHIAPTRTISSPAVRATVPVAGKATLYDNRVALAASAPQPEVVTARTPVVQTSLAALGVGTLASALLFFWGKASKKPESWALATTSSNKVYREGFEMQREGIKVAAKDTILTPRFYTTDFEECARMFSKEINPRLDMKELEAMRTEFVKDYNQNHFVRNDKFKPAAEWVSGDNRKIFVEFLERSCTAEFSGFLLYKELGRRLKDINPVVSDIFTLMARDEARHAGFLNKTMSDFNLALDLGFLTKHREYTFFQPKFIVYATYLSEKIGYWRYITIYRHLQRNPEHQFNPLFQYFENWCQDETRHGDFLAAVLKTQPTTLQGWDSKLWCRFFCHAVYITMYLNDHQRTKFYEQCGLNTTQFNQHVIKETNATTRRIF
eukprot:EG_transcript_13553